MENVDISVSQRFWSYVKTASKNVCWEWQLSLDRGYGRFSYRGKNIRAHRMAAFLSGKLPDLLDRQVVVRHTCHNRQCVNPEHLAIGTPQDNNLDTIQAGRRPARHNSKHPEWLKALVLDLFTSGHNPSSIARQLEVSKYFVFSLIKRQT